MDDWQRIHAQSISDPDAFWLDITRKNIVWELEPSIGLEGGFDTIEQDSSNGFQTVD